jgi:hypothetical protein
MVVTRWMVNGTGDALHNAQAYFLQQGPTLRDKYGAQGYFYMYKNGVQGVLHMANSQATVANAKAAFVPFLAEMNKIAGNAPNSSNINEPKYYTYNTYKEFYAAENGNEAMEDSGARWLSWSDATDGTVPSQAEALQNPLRVLPFVWKDMQTPLKRRHAVDRDISSTKINNAFSPAQSFDIRSTSGKAMGDDSGLAAPMPRTYLDSRLLTPKHMQSVSQARLAKMMKDLFGQVRRGVPGQAVRGFMYGGKVMSEPATDSVSVLPAWRDMIYHFITDAVPGDIRHDYNIQPVAKLFPDAGAYVNEV